VLGEMFEGEFKDTLNEKQQREEFAVKGIKDPHWFEWKMLIIVNLFMNIHTSNYKEATWSTSFACEYTPFSENLGTRLNWIVFDNLT
jgi:hypothetical protein